MDVSRLKVQELKDELEKRGVTTTKSMKKKDLFDLLEEAIAKEDDPSASINAASSTEEAAASPATVESLSTAATSPPPAASALSPPAVAEEAPATSTIPPAPATFPPVANEDETPLSKTDDQLAQTEKEEQAGAGERGAEGAQQAGIAMSVVESLAASDLEMQNGGEEPVVEAAVLSNKRPLEEEEVPSKKPRLASPIPDSTYPPNFIPSSHPPTRALYITNLRRPLPDSSLAAHLSSFGSLDTSASVGKDACGWWLSPVKSHAFAVFNRVESAVKAYTALQGCTTFPEEAGEGKIGLKVTFLPAAPIQGLIKQEVKAWTEEGRRKLELLIEKNEEGEWELSYKGVGDVNLAGSQSLRGSGSAPGMIGSGFVLKGRDAGYSQGFRGGAGYAQQQQPPRTQPPTHQPQSLQRRELGSATGSAVSGGGTYIVPGSYDRAPVANGSNPAYNTFSNAPRSNYINPSSSSTSAPFLNGLDRSRPPHEPSSGVRTESYSPRTDGPASYDRRTATGSERVTETAPRLSWGERGVYGNGGSGGGRGTHERDERRRDNSRRGGRDERDDRDDRERRLPWGERRR